MELLKSELLNEQILINCMEVLVTKYFMLRKGDLEGWEEDPEAWSMAWEDSSESWEFLIRPCAEKLFMDLVVHEKAKLAGPLKQVFDSCSSKFSLYHLDSHGYLIIVQLHNIKISCLKMQSTQQ